MVITCLRDGVLNLSLINYLTYLIIRGVFTFAFSITQDKSDNSSLHRFLNNLNIWSIFYSYLLTCPKLKKKHISEKKHRNNAKVTKKITGG